MIELRTGLPGNGKTLSVIAELAKQLESWEKKPDEARPIFQWNVKGLTLPITEMPVKEIKVRQDVTRLVPDYDAMPDGSFVLIDECQDIFPPRSSQSEAPPHVAWMNRHRHRGFDFVLVTQHPKLIDSGIRALVGKHKHYRRMFGSKRSAVYEWDGCSDGLSGMKDAVLSHFSFPKDAYKFYKSAEVHTKQRFRLPLWFALPILAVVMGVFFLPRAYQTLTAGIGGKGLQTSATPTKAQGQGVGQSTASGAAGGALATTSQPVQTVQAVLVAEKRRWYVGCVGNSSRCSCVDEAGEVEPVDAQVCADHFAGKKALIRLDVGGQSRRPTASKPEPVPSPVPVAKG